MATCQTYSISQKAAITAYIDGLVITTGIYIYDLESTVYIISW